MPSGKDREHRHRRHDSDEYDEKCHQKEENCHEKYKCKRDPTGPMGATGARGATGSVGPKGDTGATGPLGPTGIEGPQGLRGDVGCRGPPGCKGDEGCRGPRGCKGERGATGLQGPAGPTGAAGSSGTNGATGPTGPGGSGPTGPTGPAGQGSNLWQVASVTVEPNTTARLLTVPVPSNSAIYVVAHYVGGSFNGFLGQRGAGYSVSYQISSGTGVGPLPASFSATLLNSPASPPGASVEKVGLLPSPTTNPTAGNFDGTNFFVNVSNEDGLNPAFWLVHYTVLVRQTQ